jgi:bifunctional non-homologous end joining protein LigD
VIEEALTEAAEGSRLSTYRSMRDTNKTPEPMGSSKPTRTKAHRTGPMFVIQEHHATALHWDFRLEHDNVFVSWALPKGLPLDPTTNHLAIHTEDHPLEYGSFEGEIPKGEYGGGKVTIWDRGTYDLEKWRDDEVKVVLHGSRASGRYVLFPTHGKNWMIHRMDPPPVGFASMPSGITPMLALAGALPTDDRGWAYEFKWDGVRALVAVDGGRARITSRNKKDFTRSFPELTGIGAFASSRATLLDGEIVIFDDFGRPNFGQLAQRLHLSSQGEIKRRSVDTPTTYLAFDLLYLDGESLLERPYEERRHRLEQLHFAGDRFATPPAFIDAHGSDVLRAARERHLEGVVAKRRDSPYRPGIRGGEWVKVKNFRTQEVVIGGWTEGNGARAGGLGALLLGVYDKDGFVYIGRVGTGFTGRARADLLGMLRPLMRKTSPFCGPMPTAEVRGGHFVTPKVVGEVQFGEWTAGGRLRHPSWRGLRSDKVAKSVRREP